MTYFISLALLAGLTFLHAYAAQLEFSRIWKLRQCKRHSFGILVTSALDAVLLVWICQYPVSFWLLIAGMILLVFCQLLLVFRANPHVLFWHAINFAFKFSCAVGITDSLCALVLQGSIAQVLHNRLTAVWAVILAFVLTHMLTILYYHRVEVEKIRCLEHNIFQLRFLGVVECLLFAFRVFTSYSDQLGLDCVWFNLFRMSSCMVLLVCYYMAAIQAIHFSLWLEEEVKIQLLKEQIAQQKLHYEEYQRYVSSFTNFKSDYERITGEIRHSIVEGEREDALNLLSDITMRVDDIAKPFRRYSNNMLVDAMLEDMAALCSAGEIAFQANVFLPDWFTLSELDTCRVFTNICRNAREACAQIADKTNRRISISSGVLQNWLTITTENTFEGERRMEGGRLVSTKPNAAFHGVGISSVKEIIEAEGGFLNIEIGKTTKIFKISLHFPRPIS